ncbi:MAG: zinc-ribbon domain-containing protein, partial [Bacteroidetes bacterium]|nr:zinc-ribbon domain-containing protein [Candidatus Cryptobacteroides avistercoris]
MADERFLEKQLQRSREKTMEKHSAKTADGGRCPHCGAAVGSSWEFCPACGGSLVPY